MGRHTDSHIKPGPTALAGTKAGDSTYVWPMAKSRHSDRSHAKAKPVTPHESGRNTMMFVQSPPDGRGTTPREGGAVPGRPISPSREANESLNLGMLSQPGQHPAADETLELRADKILRRVAGLFPANVEELSGWSAEIERAFKRMTWLSARAMAAMTTLSPGVFAMHGNSFGTSATPSGLGRGQTLDRLQEMLADFRQQRSALNELEHAHADACAQVEAVRRRISELEPMQAAADGVDSPSASTETAAPQLPLLRNELQRLEHGVRGLLGQLNGYKDVANEVGRRLHCLVAVAELVDVAGAVLSAELAALHLQHVRSELVRLGGTTEIALRQLKGDPKRGLPGQPEAQAALIETFRQRRDTLMSGCQTAVANFALQEQSLATLNGAISDNLLCRYAAALEAAAPETSLQIQREALEEIDMLAWFQPELMLARSEAQIRLEKAADHLDEMGDEADLIDVELDKAMR